MTATARAPGGARRPPSRRTIAPSQWAGVGGIKSVQELMAYCEGAYAQRTLKGYRADLCDFTAWCADENRVWLPATSETIAAYIADVAQKLSVSTIKRRLAAVAFAHRHANLTCPISDSAVKLKLRRATRTKSARPKQAGALTVDMLGAILKTCGDDLQERRDAALLSIGYDTLCRAGEIAAMQVEHLRRGKAAWSVLIPRSKNDTDGRIAWISPRSVNLVKAWLKRAGIDEGPLFRAVCLARAGDGPLDTSSIRRLMKRAALRAGFPKRIASTLSGHSMRIGAAQDMLTAGFDGLAIMQAGGWKTPHVVMRYVENASTRAMHERRWKALQTETR